MEKIMTYGFLLMIGMVYAQEVPDQNPNYKKSKDYYMNNYSQYTATQGTTAQQTYTPFVESTRMSLRHDRKMARIQGRSQVRVARANRPVFTRRQRGGFQQGFNTMGPNYGLGYNTRNRGWISPYSNVGLRWGNNGITPYWDLGLGLGY